MSGSQNNWYAEYNPQPANRISAPSWHINDDMNTGDGNGNIAGPTGRWWGAAATNPMSGVWSKIEMLVRWSNGTDGSIEISDNGRVVFNYAGPTDRLAGTARAEAIGGFTRVVNSNNWRYFTDLYLDYTFARVILGDAPTLAASTRREMQIPAAWSDTSVNISVNLGAFPNSGIAYLFVVNADGTVNSQGYPINIGTGAGDAPPVVTIASPTSAATYSTAQESLALAGTAVDDHGIVSVRWTNDRGGSGTATNQSGNWSSWSVPAVALVSGQNVITISATDSAGMTSSATLTVTVGGNQVVWSAAKQTGDTAWKDSGVTYCVRLLIDGSQISQSGAAVRLSFMGRSTGSYTIRKVSIAERNTTAPEGAVVASTWTRVTFDARTAATWNSDSVVVPAGTEKVSDPVSFPVRAGKDYYVTFKIDSPSVYLNPPSEYRELYFSNSDHAEDVDWAGTGFSVAQDYHALSAIYVVSGLPPAAPVGVVIR